MTMKKCILEMYRAAEEAHFFQTIKPWFEVDTNVPKEEPICFVSSQTTPFKIGKIQ
jgi:hypothetical protein